MVNKQVEHNVSVLKKLRAVYFRQLGNCPEMAKIDRSFDERIAKMRSEHRSSDPVADALSDGDMFYIAPDGSGRTFRVCREHQPDPSDINDDLDLDAIADCDNCSEVDPITDLDLPDTDDPDADNPDNDDEGDDDAVV